MLDPSTAKFLAVDTETTGVDFLRPYEGFKIPARVFMVSACDHDGRQWVWKFKVDAFTRRVDYTSTKAKASIAEIRRVIGKYKTLVFHNAKFDVRALSISRIIDLTDRWDDIHDTNGAAHVIDSKASHGLKDLGIRYLDQLDNDQSVLREAVKKCHSFCRNKDILIPTTEIEADYFLPAYLAERYPNDAYFQEVTANAEKYARLDARRTALLWIMFRKGMMKLQCNNPFGVDDEYTIPNRSLYCHYERERKLIRVFYDMESIDCGLRIRPNAARKAEATMNGRMTDLEAKLVRMAAKWGLQGYNPRSDRQTALLLFDKSIFGLTPVVFTETKLASVAHDPLVELQNALGVDPPRKAKRGTPAWNRWNDANDFIDLLLSYRSAKTSATYLKNYKEHTVLHDAPRHVAQHAARIKLKRPEQYIHPSVNQWGTATVRISSSNPNGTNVGGKDMDSGDEENAFVIRSIFGPEHGRWWLSIDYNQLELRLLAKASGDTSLRKILNEGVDRHQLTCDAINAVRASLNLPPIIRKIAKNINFAWGYGAGDAKLSKMAGINAADFRLAMRTAYPDVVTFMDDCSSFARRHGYIETMLGYRLVVPQGEPYKATNYRIQGTAGDLVKNAMLACYDYLDLRNLTKVGPNRVCLLLQIHDELVFETPANVPLGTIRDLKTIMESTGDTVACPTPVNAKKIITDWATPLEVAA